MLSAVNASLRSWMAIGLVLATVLAVDGYQSRGRTAAVREDSVVSILGRRRVAVSGSAFGAETRSAERGTRTAGRVTAVAGSAELDLRKMALEPGDEIQIDIMAVMGAVVVRVPDGWTIDARAVPMLGAIRDRRLRPFDALDAALPSEGPAPRLVLRGAIVMGELVLKS